MMGRVRKMFCPIFLRPEVTMKAPRIKKRTYPSGNVSWQVRYMENGEEKFRQFQKKTDAEKAVSVIHANQLKGKLGLPESSKVALSLSDTIEQLFRDKKERVATSTLSRYNIYARHLQEFLAKYFPNINQINQIKKTYLEEHLAQLKRDGISNNTINGHIRFLKILFNYAIAEELIRINPAAKLQKLKVQKDGTVEYWEVEELKDIFATVVEHWRDPIQFLYLTGLRKGELINLTWKDVTLEGDRGEITIQSKDGWETKTKTSRKVPLSPDAVAIVKRCKKYKEHNWVFTGLEGSQVHPDRIYLALKYALKKLGLAGTIHQLRHTFASHLVMNDVGIETVSRLLGHTDIMMTMRYAHLAPYKALEAVNKLTL